MEPPFPLSLFWLQLHANHVQHRFFDRLDPILKSPDLHHFRLLVNVCVRIQRRLVFSSLVLVTSSLIPARQLEAEVSPVVLEQIVHRIRQFT